MCLHMCMRARSWYCLLSFSILLSCNYFFSCLTQGLTKQPWLSWNSLYRPRWPQTHRDPPASSSQALGIKTSVTGNIWVEMCECVNVCVCASVYLCVSMYVSVYKCVLVSVCVSVCKYVWVWVCVCVCVCVWVYMWVYVCAHCVIGRGRETSEDYFWHWSSLATSQRRDLAFLSFASAYTKLACLGAHMCAVSASHPESRNYRCAQLLPSSRDSNSNSHICMFKPFPTKSSPLSPLVYLFETGCHYAALTGSLVWRLKLCFKFELLHLRDL